MKRAIMIVSLLFIGGLIACDVETPDDKEEIDALEAWFEPIFEGTDNLTSTITIESEDPDRPQSEIILKVDGENEYYSTVDEEDDEIIYIVGDNDEPMAYLYDEEDDTWLEEPAVADETLLKMTYNNLFEAPLQSEWFEAVNDVYQLREAHFEDVFGDAQDEIEFDDFEIVLHEGEMIMTISGVEDGYVNSMTIKVYDKGTTEITLPDFGYEPIEALDEWFTPIFEDWHNLSATITVSSEAPDQESIEINTKTTADKDYFHTIEGEVTQEIYVVIEEGSATAYSYDDDADEWMSQPTDADQTMLQLFMLDLFTQPLKSSWFKAENDVYQLKEAYISTVFPEFEDVDDVDFTITHDENAMTMTMTGEEDGYDTELEFVFYDKGTTEIILPDFDE